MTAQVNDESGELARLRADISENADTMAGEPIRLDADHRRIERVARDISGNTEMTRRTTPRIGRISWHRRLRSPDTSGISDTTFQGMADTSGNSDARQRRAAAPQGIHKKVSAEPFGIAPYVGVTREDLRAA